MRWRRRLRANRNDRAVTAARLEAVSLAIGGRTVLSGIDLAIPAGRFVGLLGPNGAGKTTLLRGLLGVVAPAAGRITVFGEIARPGGGGIGYLPQTRPGPLPQLRGFDLLALSMRGARWGLPHLSGAERAEIDWALTQTDAAALAGRRLASLSGGERQRVLIAQALLGRPRLLLLDEPLAGLDPRHQAETVALLAGLRDRLGLTVLCSAHDLDVVLPALDQVLYLGGGRALLGSVADVVTAPVLSALYGAPMQVIRAGGRVFVVPEVPQAVVPEAPRAVVPAAPQAVVPDVPQALVPEAPGGAAPATPGARMPEAPGAVASDAAGQQAA